MTRGSPVSAAETGEPLFRPAATASSIGQKAGRRSPERLSVTVLRLGLAFVFGYAAVTSLVHPELVAQYVPMAVPPLIASALLPLFGVYELGLAVGLMSRRHVNGAAMLAMLTLVVITLLNLDAFGVLFRNVAIGCAAASLWLETASVTPSPVPLHIDPRAQRD
jgi:hypothetical protein